MRSFPLFQKLCRRNKEKPGSVYIAGGVVAQVTSCTVVRETRTGRWRGTRGPVTNTASPTCKQCSRCGWQENRYCSLKFCGHCQTTMYCSQKCQKEHYNDHRAVCKTINSAKTFLTEKKQNLHTKETIKGHVYELSPKTQSKICKHVGDKCLVNVVMNHLEEQVLWDTGAQVSLVDEKWVTFNKLKDHVRPLHELFDRELVIRSASGDEFAHMGWIDMYVSLRSDKQGLNVPFLVTRDKLDKPILDFNVIKEFINDADVKYIFQIKMRKLLIWLLKQCKFNRLAI